MLIKEKLTSKIMLSKHNYGISMDLMLPDGKEVHIFHENIVNNKVVSKYSILDEVRDKNNLLRNYTYSYNAAAQFPRTQKIPIPKLVIVSGIPTSGKTTWIKKVLLPEGFVSISRDDIREEIYGNYKKIVFSFDSENRVSEIFENKMRKAIAHKDDIVLDNTHAKKGYLDAAIKRFEKEGYEIYIKFFDISKRKAYFRNIKRYLMTGKWIPFKVIDAMYNNYNKINKNDYISYRW